MSTVQDALSIARTLLNDDRALQWTDPVLMPKLVQAHGEMVQKLVLNGLPLTREETSPILVLAGATTLGVDLPPLMIEPIKMDEWTPGDPISNAFALEKVEFIPNLDLTDTLRYWSWIDQQIQFLGCKVDRNVHLYYLAGAKTPTLVTDPLFFNNSEIFLGPRTAALCSIRDTGLYTTTNNIADQNLSLLVRTQVKGDQTLPVRRRPFSYAIRSRRRTI